MTSKTFSIEINTDLIILYHGNCPDGFTSAFIVWRYLKNRFGEETANQAKYIPCFYSNKPLNEKFLEKLKGKNILMCDFSYKYEQFMQIYELCNSIIILDHHATAEKELIKVSNELKIFDMTKCGAVIVWEYLMKEPIPLFLEYIQDRDLWTKNLPFCDEFSIALSIENMEFSVWENLFSDEKVNELIEFGKSYNEYNEYLIDSILKTSYMRKFEDYTVACVNSPILKSDIGNRLIQVYPDTNFSLVYNFSEKQNCTAMSLRSSNDKMDVSIIAKECNGGGHRNASGCSCPGFTDKLNVGKSEILIDMKYNSDEKKYDEQKCIKYKNYMIRNLTERLNEDIYQMNRHLSIVGYLNCPILKEEIANSILNENKNIDYVVINHYDPKLDSTEFYCKSRTNVHKIAEKTILKGFIERLPYHKVDNYGIFDLFSKNYMRSFKAANKEYNYVVFNSGPFKGQLLDPDYFRVIERRFQDCFFLIFQVPTDMVHYEGNDVKKIYEYEIFYNKNNSNSKTNKDMMNQLKMSYSHDSSINFQTHRSLDVVIENIINKFNDDYEVSSGEEDDNID